MAKEVITLSIREVERLRILHKVLSRHLRQLDAAALLGLSDRQVRNIIRKIRQRGDRGIAHGNRGREAPNKMSTDEEVRIGKLVEEHYRDFGPTLASEKLWERHGIRVGREKLRQLMIEQGLWKVRSRRSRHVHKWRERRSYVGEMVQLDGSHHDWLEDRGPRMVFMGYIDDATNRVFGRFYDHEGVYPAMDSMMCYIRRYGIPQSVYLDKHSTYKTTRQPNLEEELRGRKAATQFARALEELGIEMIHATSPQAKGRVERLFGTLQDRLVKDMRLAKISSMEDANAFLEEYLDCYNERFSRAAKREDDLHRPVPEDIELREILCIRGTRTINEGFLLKWKHRLYVLDKPSIALLKRRVVVREHFDGEVTFKFKDRYLDCHEVFEVKPKKKEAKPPAPKRPRKQSQYRPAAEHPWKRTNFMDLPDRW